MSYIERELTEGEQIVLLGHVSWWTIVPQTLLAAAVLVVAAVVAGFSLPSCRCSGRSRCRSWSWCGS